MISKLFKKFIKYKIAVGLVLVVVISFSYWGYRKIFSNDNAVRYATIQVQKGTFIVSVSGSGQVSASNQIDVKAKVSGDVIYVGVQNEQEVKAGTLIAQLDARDAQKAVRDAELNLESAILSLDKLKLNQHSQLKSPNKSYEEGMDILANFYDELPNILDNLKSVYFQADLSSDNSHCKIDYFLLDDCNITYYAEYEENKKKFTAIPSQIFKLYREIDDMYNKNKFDYQNVKRNGDNKEQFSAIEKGREIAVKIAEMIKNGRDVISSFQDIQRKNGVIFTKQEIVNNHISYLNNYSNTITTYANNLLSVINHINDYVSSIENQPLDLRTQELIVKQRENALFTARQNLNDYYIRAPFDGIIAKVNVKKGDSILTGASIATLVTRQKIAEVSLNEVDIAKVRVGQKAILTFDAVSDLTITGQVTEVDMIGTVSNGVVSYTVKIGFDTQDDRIKIGMSVSAVITTEEKSNVLFVPNSAVKFRNGVNYVELPNKDDLLVAAKNNKGALFKNPIRQQQVKIGLSNDDFTEIVSGLQEGDMVVTRIIRQTTQAVQTKKPPFFNNPKFK